MLEEAVRSREDLFAEIRAIEKTISAARSRQVRLLRDLGRTFRPPSVAEIAAELDVSSSTARDLRETATRTPELSPSMEKLESGAWSFDRAAAIATLIPLEADESTIAEAERRDIAGVHRLRATLRRITRRTERQAHAERSVRAWPSLDSAAGFINAQLTGHDWQVVTSALDSRGDLLPRDAAATAEQRRADALVALAQDWLDERIAPAVTGSSAAVVSVVVDPTIAGLTDGEAGAIIPGGPRIGPETLDEIMCGGAVEVLVSAVSGVPLAVGPTSQVVPPKVRRMVLARDGGCVIDGCSSRYRLQVHHVIPRSAGGTHDGENLVTLCWYHHHVSVHGEGMTLDPSSPPMRRRLVPAGRDP